MSSILPNPALWSALCSAENCPFAELESLGYAQPIVRKSAWALLQSTVRLSKGKGGKLGELPCFPDRSLEYVLSVLPTLSTAVLRSAWTETDTNVHAVMWQPLLTFLRGTALSAHLVSLTPFGYRPPELLGCG